jgi:histidine triad (HIT) family protein
MSDCLFCKIARKETPADVVYEDDAFIAFLDIKPTSEGHTLVIPKAHFDGFMDTPAEVAGALIGIVQKVARAAISGVGATAFNIGVNTGKEAGQVIFHTHIHIIPRKTGDGLEMWHGKTLPESRMKEIFAAIKENMVNGA